MSTIGVASPRVFKAAWGHGKNDNCMSKQSSRTSHFRCRVRTGVFAKASDASTDSTRNELTTELLQILGKGTEGSARMARSGDRKRLEQLVEELEALNPTPEPFENIDLLLEEWQLLSTFQPGTGDVQFLDPQSWQKYLFESGPSPVQSLVVGNQTVDNVLQVLEDPRESFGDAKAINDVKNRNINPKWQNIVEFGPGLSLVIEAQMEGIRDANSFFYRFSGGYFNIENEWGGPDGLKIPYPVPFDLLEKARPGQTKGWFSTTYLDDTIRISRGNKGSVFVLKRPQDYWQVKKAREGK